MIIFLFSTYLAEILKMSRKKSAALGLFLKNPRKEMHGSPHGFFARKRVELHKKFSTQNRDFPKKSRVRPASALHASQNPAIKRGSPCASITRYVSALFSRSKCLFDENLIFPVVFNNYLYSIDFCLIFKNFGDVLEGTCAAV